MFNKNIKLALVILVFAWAIYQFVEGFIGNGIMFVLLSGIFVLLYFKNEIIIMAFLRLRKQDFEGADRWLNKIKNPEASLTRKQQGYFHYLKGLMLSQTNMNEADKLFRKALTLGLSMKHDQAMAKLNMAGIALTRRRKREATQLLSEVKKLDKQNMLTEQVRMMQQQLKRI